jgi:hypothetical protein
MSVLCVRNNRDIIGHIVYDFQDKEMMERFRPSLGACSVFVLCVVVVIYISGCICQCCKYDCRTPTHWLFLFSLLTFFFSIYSTTLSSFIFPSTFSLFHVSLPSSLANLPLSLLYHPRSPPLPLSLPPEEAMPVKHQNVALDYIGKRGSAINVGRRERVQYAREILQKEVSSEG